MSEVRNQTLDVRGQMSVSEGRVISDQRPAISDREARKGLPGGARGHGEKEAGRGVAPTALGRRERKCEEQRRGRRKQIPPLRAANNAALRSG
jgi:hypothetical protein